ncbi:hypothetical protein PV10_00466 [Exophiala mesophila]|uniref:AB hydrolase-1 domain-containing protein n=1 Tax=Exophiala mesophila TaxID=212818 RepID=A0A0D1ZPU9_EXOME|nr:uncharacterized protein PV10_00466 [Exophiala mesophila]KIV96627.1 hypothetical protein PV10_00466 [Exophiala mesophila]
MANPVQYTYGAPNTGSTAKSIPHPEPVSALQIHVAGILVTVFGLNELPNEKDTDTAIDGGDDSPLGVSILWLLHPRLQTQECMAPFAGHLIHEWNTHRKTLPRTNKNRRKGLIAISFDQRNHGTRLVVPLANEAWRSGNERHALDMYSCYAGTAADVSLLLDYIPGYIFATGTGTGGASRVVERNLVMGISLGGHAVWHVLCNDPRFTAGISVVGCPDYARLMADRARLSKRKSWLDGQGKEFFGSVDFPEALVESMGRGDPAGVVWGHDRKSDLGLGLRPGDLPDEELSEEQISRVKPVMKRVFGDKRVLVLSGGADKLVNYRFSKPFLDWVRKVSEKDGWFHDGGLYLEDHVFEGVGHEVTPPMVERMVDFLNQTLAVDESAGKVRARRGSKI